MRSQIAHSHPDKEQGMGKRLGVVTVSRIIGKSVIMATIFFIRRDMPKAEIDFGMKRRAGFMIILSSILVWIAANSTR